MVRLYLRRRRYGHERDRRTLFLRGDASSERKLEGLEGLLRWRYVNARLERSLVTWTSCFVDWTKSTLQKRKGHVDLLLEGLEHKDAVIRFVNARRLFYIVQGRAYPCALALRLKTEMVPCRNFCRNRLS